MQRKALPDDGPPSAGAKGDLVLFLVTARAVEALFQDKDRLIQIFAGVDAQYLILIVDLVAFHTHAGVNQAMRAVGQPVLAVHRRGR